MRFMTSFMAFLFLIVMLSMPNLAGAHFEKTDKTISAELHVDPNDNPIPGEQAFLYFLFGDSTNRFSLSDCNCSLTISEAGKQIYKQMVVYRLDPHPNIWGTRIPYVFPARDVYHLTLTGKPKTLNAFQAFSISWDFRVEQYPKNQQPSLLPTFTKYLLISLVIGFGLQGLILLVSKIFGERARLKRKK